MAVAIPAFQTARHRCQDAAKESLVKMLLATLTGAALVLGALLTRPGPAQADFEASGGGGYCGCTIAYTPDGHIAGYYIYTDGMLVFYCVGVFC